MLESLQLAPPDPILGLAEAYRADPNPNKISLSVGVYKDADGKTPILDCVKEAERRLLADEPNKAYLAIDGLSEYATLTRDLLLAKCVEESCAATVQTPGGTGALRVAADFLQRCVGTSRIWVSAPTWANHGSVFGAAGLAVDSYPYMDDSSKGLNLDAMVASLSSIPAGDAVLLHACCHNPTGIDPAADQWGRIANVIRERDLMPVIDCAYQGFGDGLEEDAAGLRRIAGDGEAIVCSSFSKNFGLYAERIGALTVVGGGPDATAAALSQVKACVRANYSNPPKHGGAIVSIVLADRDLRSRWEREVADMRTRIRDMRSLFVEAMKAQGVDRDFAFILNQKGMFSFSGLTRLQVDQLRNDHSIYIVGSGRINVAGITPANVDQLAAAIAAVL
ncbi:MAG: amino acid aminotransferase [Pirellulaceae bacterium]|jgi:aspartate/tyrosine/aromatic aminotransferase|nr:amino acid aminotransferase [Pirellulaceae bacterium]MDP7015566.1 amino acid aminotransferase [Pirellulaceae bacterium]